MEPGTDDTVWIAGSLILNDDPGPLNPADWEGFFALVDQLDLPADFMADRTDGPPEPRDPF